jgi:DNA-directed RNA polymerase subunit RPC12/RpoP
MSALSSLQKLKENGCTYVCLTCRGSFDCVKAPMKFESSMSCEGDYRMACPRCDSDLVVGIDEAIKQYEEKEKTTNSGEKQ